ncbi:MAG: hypothetical protein Sapg2KO_32310 [Saprospiraceae bacterium]
MLFFFSACTSNHPLDDFQKQAAFTFELDPSGISSVPNWQLNKLEAGWRYAYFHIYENAIKVFDFEKQELLNDIAFLKEGPNGVDNVIDFYLDDDFVLTVSGQEIVKADYKGTVLERFSNQRISEAIGQNLMMVVNSNYRFETSSYDLKNSRLFMIVRPTEGFFDQSPGMVSIDMQTANINYIALETPANHQAWRPLKSRLLLRDYYYPYLDVSEDYLIYNFAGSPDFYLVDLEKVAKKPRLVQRDFAAEMYLNMEQFNQAPDKLVWFAEDNYYFGPIKYDAQKAVFYQVYYHPLQVDPGSGGKNQKVTLNAWNKQLKPIATTEIIEPSDGYFRGWCLHQGTILNWDLPDAETEVPYIKYVLASE